MQQTVDNGVILVGKTRVTLDTVVAVFDQGATAEEIAYRYPSGFVKRSPLKAIFCLSKPIAH